MTDLFEIHESDGRITYRKYNDEGDEQEYTSQEIEEARANGTLEVIPYEPPVRTLNEEQLSKLQEAIDTPMEYWMLEDGKFIKNTDKFYCQCIDDAKARPIGSILFIPVYITTMAEIEGKKMLVFKYEFLDYCEKHKYTKFKYKLWDKELKKFIEIKAFYMLKIKTKMKKENFEYDIIGFKKLKKFTEDAKRFIFKQHNITE